MTDLEDNKAHSRKFFESWNKRDSKLLDAMFSRDFVLHTSAAGVAPNLSGIKQWISELTGAFPDVYFTVDQQIAEGDWVTTRWTARGTHKGPMMGIAPTGNKIKVTGIGIVRIVDGKTMELITEWNVMGVLRQIGAVPPLKQTIEIASDGATEDED